MGVNREIGDSYLFPVLGGQEGGLAALLGTKITASEILAYEDLGPEAIRRLMVKDFPPVLAYDAHGGSVYERRAACGKASPFLEGRGRGSARLDELLSCALR